MMAAILRFLHMSKEEPSPLDKIQMEAAKDRLHQRSEELTDSFDELSRMINRMKRSRSKQ